MPKFYNDNVKNFPCSYRVISRRTGKPIHGTAAMLAVMHDDGGPDAHIEKIAREAAAIALRNAVRPRLKLAK